MSSYIRRSSDVSYPMTVNYLYDSLDRVTEVHYPAQYGLAGSPRKVVENSYDSASRLSEMKYDGANQASDIVYNASDQTTSVKIGVTGANQVTENYTFDPQTGLLANQTAVKGSTTLLDLSYDYAKNGSGGALTGKTGALTKIINTHPYEKGDVLFTLPDGTKAVALDQNFPSVDDRNVSSKAGLYGIAITSTSIAVFGGEGRRCRFDR